MALTNVVSCGTSFIINCLSEEVGKISFSICYSIFATITDSGVSDKWGVPDQNPTKSATWHNKLKEHL